MKQLHVLGVMLAVLVAGLSVAEEDAAVSITGEENNPLNAVVKLEVSTTKPVINWARGSCCPSAFRC